MNIYAQEIFKRNLQLFLFIGIAVLFVLSVLINFKAIKMAGDPVLIAIDGNGSRIVKQMDDPVFKTEATAFIQRFLNSVYNFDSQNFIKRIGYATSLMSEDLWKSKRSSILDLKNKVEQDEITLSGQIVKITKDEDSYHALIEASEKSRLNIQSRKIKVLIRLKVVSRTSENPWGLEVDAYEEDLIR